MITKILHYYKGIVKVRIVSHSPERFFNLCRHHQIILYELVFQEGYYECQMCLRDFRMIRPIARKSHTRLFIIGKYGLPFFLYRNRHRKVTYISCIAFIAVLYIMSLFIWDIQFEGNRKYTDDVLMTFLHSQGYVQGMKVSTVVCEDLEKAIRNKYDDINWVSARIDGTRLVVKIKENTGILKIEENDQKEGDLIADKEGTVVSVITRKGTPLVHKGDFVKAGDMLVAGIINILDDGGGVIAQHRVQADADVVLERTYEYNDFVEASYIKRNYGKERTHYFVQFFNYRFQIFPIKKEDNMEIITSKYQCHLFSNFYIPIYYGSCQEKRYEEEVQYYTQEQTEQLCEQNLQHYFENLEKLGVEIIQNNVTIKWEGNGCDASGTIIVHEKTGTLSKQQQIEETTKINEYY
ncbi:MAG: sporulation protein YqfD [Clostridiales bacterium]|nr:sporulation protein YqfD [Clostridiales bacterium]